MNRFAALLISSPLIVATASGTPAPAPRADSRADLEKLQGAWEVASVERGGKVRRDPAPGAKVVFAGSRYSQYGADGRPTASSPFVVDARARPKRLTLGKTVVLACRASEQASRKACWEWLEKSVGCRMVRIGSMARPSVGPAVA
jgi:uncharacterized protein (TIGR03067 family)